jgi:hypothetical protein
LAEPLATVKGGATRNPLVNQLIQARNRELQAAETDAEVEEIIFYYTNVILRLKNG